MYCANCGKQLPDDANFCINCGKPQKGVLTSYNDSLNNDDRYEYCTIVYEPRSTMLGLFKDFRFWAKAAGPEGTYSAAETNWVSMAGKVPDRNYSLHNELYEDLVDKLLKDGWDKTGVASIDVWFSDQFRRRVKKTK